MTYNERLNEIAEKMAKASYSEYLKEEPNEPTWEIFSSNKYPSKDYDTLKRLHIPLAVIALEEMAKEAKSFYRKGWIDGGMEKKPNPKDYLEISGLIPTQP